MTREEALDRLEQAYNVIRSAPWAADVETLAKKLRVSQETARKLMYRLSDRGDVQVFQGQSDPASALFARVRKGWSHPPMQLHTCE